MISDHVIENLGTEPVRLAPAGVATHEFVATQAVRIGGEDLTSAADSGYPIPANSPRAVAVLPNDDLFIRAETGTVDRINVLSIWGSK